MSDWTGGIERTPGLPNPGGLVAASHRCEMGAVLHVPDGSPNTDGTGGGGSLVRPHGGEGP